MHMSKEKFYKRVIACFAFMLVFPALFGETAYGQEKAFYERGNWQTLSVGDEVEGKPYAYTASGSIELGVRDKYAEMGGYTATFAVTDSSNRTYKHEVSVKGDDWGNATFPDNFNASALKPGIYSVKIYVKNQVVVSFKVKYTP